MNKTRSNHKFPTQNLVIKEYRVYSLYCKNNTISTKKSGFGGEAPQAVLLEALGGRHAALAEELVMGNDVAKPMS